jgi:hypothetical protein
MEGAVLRAVFQGRCRILLHNFSFQFMHLQLNATLHFSCVGSRFGAPLGAKVGAGLGGGSGGFSAVSRGCSAIARHLARASFLRACSTLVLGCDAGNFAGLVARTPPLEVCPVALHARLRSRARSRSGRASAILGGFSAVLGGAVILVEGQSARRRLVADPP